MNDSRRILRAFQLGKVIAAIQAANAMGNGVIDPSIVRRLRAEGAARIQERGTVVGKALRATGHDAAQRYGLGLKDRLGDHKRWRQAQRVPVEKAREELRSLLTVYAGQGRDPATLACDPARIARFQLETTTPVEITRLRDDIRQILGLESDPDMVEAQLRVETALSHNTRNRVFSIELAMPVADLTLTGSQLTSLLRTATGATRVRTLPTNLQFAKYKRFARACVGIEGKRAASATPQKCLPAHCCCWHDDSFSAVGDGGTTVRPTWPSTPDDTEWHLKQMRIKEAWAAKPPKGGKSQGEGILIAHPDTGWREHREYDQSQLRFDLARNVIDNKDGQDATRHGTLTIWPVEFQAHGTGTGATIISAEAAPNRTHVDDVPFTNMVPTSSNVQLSGIAPKAEVVPIRCTDTTIQLMDPNLQKAISHAIKIRAHVISISLGGILDADCEQAIDHAVLNHNIIVIAAAGQVVNWGENSVIEPAAFTNVVAVAGSTPALAPWDGSCRGPRVAVSAPAKGVWFAGHFLDGTPGIYWGEGTSFSAAAIAGVAALWLAHWGRDNLMARYGDVPLAHVFRHLVRKTAWKPRNWDGLYGAGIVDAYALLNEPLPAKSDVVKPSDTSDFNLFDATSDLLDLGGALAGKVWDSALAAGGAVGDLFGELLNLNMLNQGLAIISALADGAAGDVKAWADEQLTTLGGMVDDSLAAAGAAWEAVAEGGEGVVEAVGDVIEEGSDLMEDIGEDAADAWNETWDFLTSLW